MTTSWTPLVVSWKVLAFCSFQSDHAIISISESNVGRASQSSRRRCLSHHTPRSSSRSSTNAARPTGASSLNQSSLANAHPRNKCPHVSEAWSHKAHPSLSWRPCLFLRSAVHRQRWSANPKNSLTREFRTKWNGICLERFHLYYLARDT